jgi:O-antigen ligase
MFKAGWLRQLQLFLLCFLAFAIPFPFLFSAVVIILLSLVWLLRVNIKELCLSIKERKALWPWLLYFALFGISYFYSDNKSQSLFDLQSKLSLLLFPLIIGAGTAIDKILAERIFIFFIAGISVAACLSIGNAIHVYLQTGQTDHFFYHSLVSIPDMNAVYMALFTLLSLSALLFFPWETYFTGKYRHLRSGLIALQTVFFILLSSKMLLVLFFMLVVPFYLWRNFKHAQIARWKILLLVGIFTGLFITLITTHNPIRKRYEEIVDKNDLHKAWLKDYSHEDQSKFSNLTIRVIAWRLGMENIIEKNLWLTGSGNGDAQDLQNQKMQYYHVHNWHSGIFDESSELYNVNLHNMFLQSLLMIGIPGLILFSIIIFMPFFHIRQIRYKLVFLIFHVSVFAYMLQEAALQSQAGIVYYSFFAQVFWNIYYSDEKIKKGIKTITSEKNSGNLQPR